MSHSYQHSQPQQRRFLSQYNQNQLHQQIFNINIPQKSLSTSTHNFSFFGTKLVSSSSNQHYEDDEELLSPPCCFNIVSNSKRFMFGSSMDHTQLDHLSSLISPSHIDIVSTILSFLI